MGNREVAGGVRLICVSSSAAVVALRMPAHHSCFYYSKVNEISKSLTVVENWTQVCCIIALAMGSSWDETKIQIPISFFYKCQALACIANNFKTKTAT